MANLGADTAVGSKPETGGDAVDSVDTGFQEKAASPPLPREHRETPAQVWGDKYQYDYKSYQAHAPGEWDGNAAIYEFNGDHGDVGPEFPELEMTLFGNPKDRDPQGLDFSTIADIKVLQEGTARIKRITSFATAGLHPVMQKNIELCGYHAPTPIQQYTIPAINLGYDFIAISQTGSGKTAAFLIPILNKLMGKAKELAAPRPPPGGQVGGFATAYRAEPLVVIVCPTRELAVQIFHEARKFCYRTMLRPVAVYGGCHISDQISQLQNGCDILVASPGRLIDLMERPTVLSLRRVKYMVIDEADEMLHSDWDDQLNKILSGGEQEEGSIKYMLFSATFPVALRRLALTHLASNYVRIHVGRIGSSHANIKQDVIWVDHTLKRQALLDLLISLEPGRAMIFVNNKQVADDIDDQLTNLGMACTSMHSDRTQREREDSMRAFRAHKHMILVTTGVAARGIDVRNVAYVINYDLPSMDHGGIEEYTHRIGRTGRNGHKGVAYSFYTERDEPLADLLTKTLLETGQEIPDFLKGYIPVGQELEKLKFEPDSDELDEDGGGEEAGGDWGGDGGWGAEATPSGGDDAFAAEATRGDSW